MLYYLARLKVDLCDPVASNKKFRRADSYVGAGFHLTTYSISFDLQYAAGKAFCVIPYDSNARFVCIDEVYNQAGIGLDISSTYG